MRGVVLPLGDTEAARALAEAVEEHLRPLSAEAGLWATDARHLHATLFHASPHQVRARLKGTQNSPFFCPPGLAPAAALLSIDAAVALPLVDCLVWITSCDHHFPSLGRCHAHPAVCWLPGPIWRTSQAQQDVRPTAGTGLSTAIVTASFLRLQ